MPRNYVGSLMDRVAAESSPIAGTFREVAGTAYGKTKAWLEGQRRDELMAKQDAWREAELGLKRQALAAKGEKGTKAPRDTNALTLKDRISVAQRILEHPDEYPEEAQENARRLLRQVQEGTVPGNGGAVPGAPPTDIKGNFWRETMDETPEAGVRRAERLWQATADKLAQGGLPVQGARIPRWGDEPRSLLYDAAKKAQAEGERPVDPVLADHVAMLKRQIGDGPQVKPQTPGGMWPEPKIPQDAASREKAAVWLHPTVRNDPAMVDSVAGWQAGIDQREKIKRAQGTLDQVRSADRANRADVDPGEISAAVPADMVARWMAGRESRGAFRQPFMRDAGPAGGSAAPVESMWQEADVIQAVQAAPDQAAPEQVAAAFDALGRTGAYAQAYAGKPLPGSAGLPPALFGQDPEARKAAALSLVSQMRGTAAPALRSVFNRLNNLGLSIPLTDEEAAVVRQALAGGA